EQKLKIREAPLQFSGSFEIDGSVLADGGVGAPAGFNADNAVGRKHVAAQQELSVFARVDVVGNHGDVANSFQAIADRFHQGCLAGAHRSTDANLQGFCGHDRKSLASSTSWRIAAISMPGEKLQASRMSSGSGEAANWIISGCRLQR